VTIRNSVVMGADNYESSADMQREGQSIPLGIGDGTTIEGAIIDKNCRIGRGVRIANDRGVEQSPETPESMICEKLAIIQKGAALADGWKL
jgi:glucose-1-phosphate adenylyltransferase